MLCLIRFLNYEEFQNRFQNRIQKRFLFIRFIVPSKSECWNDLFSSSFRIILFGNRFDKLISLNLNIDFSLKGTNHTMT